MSNIALQAIRLGLRGAGAVSPRLGGRMAFRLFCSPPRRKAAPKADARDVFARAEVEYLPHDGEELAIYRWQRADSTPERGQILFAHGWGSQASSSHAFIDPLLGLGFDVVAYDAPGHLGTINQGTRPRVKRRTTLPASGAALLAVADHVGPIEAVVGHSYGGLVGAFVAAGAPPLDRSLPVKRLVLISSPDRFGDVARQFADVLRLSDSVHAQVVQWIEKYTEQPIDELSTGKWLAASGLPALVVHDRQDREIPFANGESSAAAAPSARLIATDGLGHRRILRDAGVIESVVDFLDQLEPTAQDETGA